LEVFRLFGSIFVDTSETDKSLDNSGKKAEGFGEKVGKVATGVGKAFLAIGAAAAGVVTAIGGMAMKSSESLNSIDKLSQKMGLSRQGFQEWGYILEQNGKSIDTLTGSFKYFQLKLADTGAEGDEVNKKLQKLGFTIEDIKNLSTEEAYDKLITAFQGMEEGAEKTALAVSLLGGRYGVELMPLLNQTAEETERLRQRVHDLGGVMSDEAIDAGVEFSNAMTDIKTTLGGLVNSISADILPAMSDFVYGLVGIVTGAEDADEKFQVATASMVNAITSKIPMFLAAGAEIVTQLAVGIAKAIPDIIAAVAAIAPQIIKTIAEGLGDIIPIIKPITAAIGFLADNFDKLLLVVVPLTAAFIAFKATLAIAGLITTMTAATKGLTVAKISATGAVKALNAAWLANPIGLVIAAVAGLVVGITALVKALRKETDEHKALKEQTEKTIDAHNRLADAVRGSAEAFEEKQNRIADQIGASQKLAAEIRELAALETRTEEQKARLGVLVDTLNDSMGESIVLYSAETDAISHTADELDRLIEKRAEEIRAIAARERAIEVAKEQMEIERQLRELAEQRAEQEAAFADVLNMTNRERRDWMRFDKANSEATAELTKKLDRLKVEFGDLTDVIVENTDVTVTAVRTTDRAEKATVSFSDAIHELTKEIDFLSAAYSENNTEKGLGIKTINELIDAGYTALLQIDAETGAVHLNTDAYYDLKRAKIDEQIISAQADRDKLVRELSAERDAALRGAGAFYDLAKAKLNERIASNENVIAANAQLAALQSMRDSVGRTAETTTRAAGSSSRAVQRATDEIKESIKDRLFFEEITTAEIVSIWEEATERFIEGTEERAIAERELFAARRNLSNEQKALYEELSAHHMSLYEQMAEAEQKYADAVNKITENVINGFKRLSTSIGLSLDEMISNVNDNADDYTEYTRLMERLSDDMSNETRAAFERLGISGLDALRELEQGGSSSMNDLNAAIARAVDASEDSLRGFREETDAIITDLNEKLQASFAEMGQLIPESLGGAMDEYAHIAVEAAGDMAQKVIDETLDVLEIASPSKPFWDMGINIIQSFYDAAAKMVAETDWPQLGDDIIDGIIEGLKRRMDALLDAFQNALDRMAARGNQTLGISSPAKKLIPTGEFSLDGVIQGVKNRTAALRAAWSEAMEIMTQPSGFGTSTPQLTTLGESNPPQQTRAGDTYNINIQSVPQTPSQIAAEIQNATIRMRFA